MESNFTSNRSHSTMRVLLTGATGFVGSHIIEELISNNNIVIALVRKTSDLKWIKDYPVQFEQCSLNDEEKLAEIISNVDIVVHCAGVVRALNWDDYYNTNVLGTKNIVNVVIKKIIIIFLN